MNQEYKHSHPTKNHLPIAVRTDVSTVRYMDIARKGYARPSFAADSAVNIRRIFTGTCLVAYFPPIEQL
jgi:hypothetical protein